MAQPSAQVAAAGPLPSAIPNRMRAFAQLTKPRLNFMVLTTTFIGYFVAEAGAFDLWRLFHTMVGTALVAGGASALNMYAERHRDARMARTARRPLPSGRVTPLEAVTFGVLLGVVGSAYLFFAVNPLTALLGLLTLLIYVWIYTPMKVTSTFNTAVGAISGALPPVMGWTAVRDTLGIEAAVLFAILFLWQHPHFFALAWMYKADYEKGGYQMLPSQDPDGVLTGNLMVLFSLALIPTSLVLSLTGLEGSLYAIGALLLGLNYVRVSVQFNRKRTGKLAKKVFAASLIYLPALMALMMLDKLT